MVLVVVGVRILLAAVRRDVASLAGRAEIAVEYHFAVEGNLDTVSLDADFLSVPFTERLVDDPFRRNQTIRRTVYLVVAQVC